jgi:type IV secretory pathway TrbL component
MTLEEQISKMKKAIAQAIKVMGDRFGSTEQDVARVIQELKASMQGSSEPSLAVKAVPGPDSQSPQAMQATIET